MKVRVALGGLAAALALSLPIAVGAGPAFADTPTVTVAKSSGVPGVRIANALSHINVDGRGDFTQRAVSVAAHYDGKPYNVIIANLSEQPQDHLTGVHFYANVKFGYVYYGLWICEGGTFTNPGDGGYINWAFIGQFTRSGPGGSTVHFH